MGISDYTIDEFLTTIREQVKETKRIADALEKLLAIIEKELKSC
jgi:hypothetical protein